MALSLAANKIENKAIAAPATVNAVRHQPPKDNGLSTYPRKTTMKQNYQPPFPSRNRFQAHSDSRQHHSNAPTRHPKQQSTVSKNQTPTTALEKPNLKNCCLRCGQQNHRTSECRMSREVVCNSCGRTGNISKVCISAKFNPQQRDQQQKLSNQSTNSIDFENFSLNIIDHQFYHRTINDLDPTWEKVKISVYVEGIPVDFFYDSCSPITIIALTNFRQHWPHIQLVQEKLSFKGYIGPSFRVQKAVLMAQFEDRKESLNIYVVDGPVASLLGLEWIRKLKIHVNLFAVDPIMSNQVQMSIRQEFSSIFFDKIGEVPNFQAALQPTATVRPVFFKPRPVAYALISRIDAELQNLIQQNIIQKMNNSDWGTPLVPVPKPQGANSPVW